MEIGRTDNSTNEYPYSKVTGKPDMSVTRKPVNPAIPDNRTNPTKNHVLGLTWEPFNLWNFTADEEIKNF